MDGVSSIYWVDLQEQDLLQGNADGLYAQRRVRSLYLKNKFEQGKALDDDSSCSVC